jgi:hypothetical protein
MDRIRQQMHSRTAKVAASALALSGSFSGLAVAGFLPDAVQESVADVAEMFGINLPRPDSVTASTEDSDGRRDEDETSGPAEEPEPSADGATADGDSDPDDQRHDDDSDDDDSDDEDRSGSGDRDSGDRDSGDRDSDGDDSDDDDSSGSKGDGRYSGDRDRDGDAADSDDPDKGDSASDAEDLEVPDVGDGDDD